VGSRSKTTASFSGMKGVAGATWGARTTIAANHHVHIGGFIIERWLGNLAR
jgi:hypothetical protein